MLWSALFVGMMLSLFAATPYTGVDALTRLFITLSIYTAVGAISYATFVAPSRKARQLLNAVGLKG